MKSPHYYTSKEVQRLLGLGCHRTAQMRIKSHTEEWQREAIEYRIKEIIKGNANWLELLKKIFPIRIPETQKWTHDTAICEVLNMVAEYKNTNYMFRPRGGGMELLGADIAGERGCIKLIHGNTTIVKPSSLTFHVVGEDPQWYYFRLEIRQLKPSGVYEKLNSSYEEITELYPGE